MVDGRDAELFQLATAHYRVEPLTMLAAYLGGILLGLGVCGAWLWHKLSIPRHLKEK